MTTHRLTPIALIFSLLGTILIACVSSPRATNAAPTCFDSTWIQSLSPLGDRFVYARVGTNQSYLLTLNVVDPNLDAALGFTISGDLNRVCSDGGSLLTYTAAGHSTIARITDVEKVDNFEEARKLAERRSGGRTK
ncbi:MAG: DUF6491 family protein [Thermoanaerobaculia bacterium]